MIYVVGENSMHAFVASNKMAELLGMERDVFMREVIWVTLFHPDADPAKYVAMIDRAASPKDAIILIGRTVAKHYGMELLGPLAVARRHGGMGSTVVAFPTPYGPNRWWNKRDNVTRATEALERIWSEHR